MEAPTEERGETEHKDAVADMSIPKEWTGTDLLRTNSPHAEATERCPSIKTEPTTSSGKPSMDPYQPSKPINESFRRRLREGGRSAKKHARSESHRLSEYPPADWRIRNRGHRWSAEAVEPAGVDETRAPPPHGGVGY